MTSFQSKIVCRLLKKFKFNERLGKMIEKNDFTQKKSNPNPSLEKICHIDIKQYCNQSTYKLQPKNLASKHWIFYLHGGAYVQGFQSIHWKFFKEIIKKTNHNIIAPDYPLLPKHSSDAMYKMIRDVYFDLLEKVGSDHITIMGDSAGGGLALGFAQMLKKENKEMPKQIILLSPWLDITLEDPLIKKIQPNDPILNATSLKNIGEILSKDQYPKDFRFSPLYGNLEGLDRISIFTGTYDILLSDARALKSKIDQKGYHINYYEYINMPHVWMFLSLPESKKAIEEIVNIINSH
jgi:acetyl esterase/lipase